ncbi:hypothetical protein OSB04_019877 [Centaurea solstitialis]|uniref:CCHC-type domain-containing protein n=1 Tax=Centaurea solstitialis TaxID=347529 RepID=A0AA38SR59_9ASTR|nr:hypothetical protein OSB04_019877 [Centaurea solstitialis]
MRGRERERESVQRCDLLVSYNIGHGNPVTVSHTILTVRRYERPAEFDTRRYEEPRERRYDERRYQERRYDDQEGRYDDNEKRYDEPRRFDQEPRRLEQGSRAVYDKPEEKAKTDDKGKEPKKDGSPTCFKCGKPGHFAKNCINHVSKYDYYKNKMNLAKKQDD